MAAACVRTAFAAYNRAHRTVGTVVGRKNHYGSRSERGTQAAAILYSLCETPKHYGIPEQVYLRKAAEHALKNPDSTLLPHQLLE